MTKRPTSCSCGLTATVTGEPARVSACYCLACQLRTGSVFGAQARFDEAADVIVLPVGAFAEPGVSAPTFPVCEERMRRWVWLPADVEHLA